MHAQITVHRLNIKINVNLNIILCSYLSIKNVK